MKLIALATLLAAAGSARAQDVDPAKVEIKTTPIGGSVSMLTGAGGNMGVSVGDDGVFVIDDQFAPLTPKIRAALATLSKQPVRFVLNTHWHGDHTGGNENFAAAGAIVVAHDNVRKRLSTEQFTSLLGKKFPPAPAKALPIVTFPSEVTFHLNGDTIHVFHVEPAHTDGDAIVHFTRANVIHTGDVFVVGYPIVDLDSGGSFDGFIAAADKLLALADDKTRIIPGHGPLADKAKLKAWRDMLVAIRGKVMALVRAKKTLAEIKAAHPTAEYDAVWGTGFIKGDMEVGMMVRSLAPELAPARK